MTAPNHLAGGIVFTGLFCSLFSINIFENPLYISFTLFGSLLPDVDHTKSYIGKAFYPLAKYIATNYGHRTITHSLLFILSVYSLSLFVEQNFSINYHISTILFFSVFSHFLFDMVTVSGIPLFYPFYKNPCVLPANPDMRIKSGNIRQEGVILFVFCLLTFFMQDLFHNGFWSTINNDFNDVKHQISEYKKNTNALDIRYDYTTYNNHYKGKGEFIQASDDEIFILENNQIKILKKGTPGLVIKTLKTYKTKKKIIQTKLEFSDYTQEKINVILHNTFVASGVFYSNFATAITTNPVETKKKFQITNQYNISFKSESQDTIQASKKKKIQDLEMKIRVENHNIATANKEYYESQNLLEIEKLKLKKGLQDYELNECKKNIIELENKIGNFNLKNSIMVQEYQKQIAELKKEKVEKISYSGEINTIQIK
jgi:inner membrane protein